MKSQEYQKIMKRWKLGFKIANTLLYIAAIMTTILWHIILFSMFVSYVFT